MKYSKFLSSLALSLPLILGAGSALALTATPTIYQVGSNVNISYNCSDNANQIYWFIDTGQGIEASESTNCSQVETDPFYNFNLAQHYLNDYPEQYPNRPYIITIVELLPFNPSLCYGEIELCRTDPLYVGETIIQIVNTPTPTPTLPAGLWTGGLTYGGAMAQIASPTAGIAGDMLPVALIVIGISLGLYLLTYVIGHFEQKKSKEKDEFSNTEK